MSNVKYCSLKSCKSTSNHKIKLFEWPKSQLIRNKWKSFFTKHGFENVEKYCSLRLCEFHFHPSDIVKHETRTQLKREAVPIFGSYEAEVSIEDGLEDESMDSGFVIDCTEDATMHEEHLDLESMETQDISTTFPVTEKPSTVESSTQTAQFDTPDGLIAAMEMKIRYLENQIRIRKKASQKSRIESTKLRNSLSKFFAPDQIQSMMGKRVRWSNKTLRKAFLLKYKLGNQFYEKTFVKKYAPFPSASTLHKKIEKFKVRTGILKINTKVLESKMKHLPLEHRSIGIVFDEKAIVPSSQSDGPSTHYEGKTTLLPSRKIREKEGDVVRATNALVVMAVGTYVREKEIVGMHYTAGCTEGEAMKEFLFSLITYVENTAKVLIDWLGFDVGASNTSFLKSCGVSLSKENQQFFIQHPNRPSEKLYLKPDETHNKKNLISALRKNDFQLSESLVQTFNLNSKKVTFNEVKKVYKNQQGTDMKPARQLKQENIHPNNFETMKERVAYEVFSSDVWGAIKFVDKNAENNGKMNATAAFLQIMFHYHAITKNQHGWSKNDEQKYLDDVEFLQWFIDEFLPGVKTPTTLKCIPAIRMSIQSLISLAAMYFAKGYEKVFVHWFLTDPIENLFSMVTSIFKKPTAVTIAQALRIISINQFDFEPVTASYSWDNSNASSIDFLEIMKEVIEEEKVQQITHKDSELEDEQIPRIEIIDEIGYDNLFSTEIQKNVFHYEMAVIFTKVYSKLACEECKKLLMDDLGFNTENKRWLIEKQEMDQSILSPSRDLMRFFMRLEFVFQSLADLKPTHQHNFANNFEASANEIPVPNEHCEATTSTIISFYIKDRLKLNLQCYLPHRALKNASKSLI